MGTCIGQVQSSLDEKTEKPAEEESEFFMNPSLSTKRESLSDSPNALTTAGVKWRKVSAACFADSAVFMGQVGKWKAFIQEIIQIFSLQPTDTGMFLQEIYWHSLDLV